MEKRKRKAVRKKQTEHKGRGNRNQMTTNVVLLAASLFAGILSWMIGSAVYEAGLENTSRPVLIGMIFFLLYIIIAITVMIVGVIRGTFEDDIFFLDSKIKIIGCTIAGGIAVFLLAMLFQWIYGLNFYEKMMEPSSYIFVIDDSGSMEQNDPDRLRYSAIEEILKDVPDEFPYMIYSFSDQAQIVRDMKPKTDGIGELPSYSSGGTAIKTVLDQVIDDYNKGIWKDDKSPKVILLTDGYATDIRSFHSINEEMKQYVKNGITISTVGLGSVDQELMQQIAKTTGGVYMDVTDASMLKEAMHKAATQYSSRDLISTRYNHAMNIRYGIMRIVFLTILGILIGGMMIIVYTQESSAKLIGISSVIKAFIGAICMEFLTSIGIYDKIAWFLLWILIACTIATMEKVLLRRPRKAGKTSRALNPY